MNNKPSSKNAAQGKVGKTSLATYGWAALLAALAGFGAVYVIAGRSDNGADLALRTKPPAAPAAISLRPGSKPATPAATGGDSNSRNSRINRLSTGKMTTFVFKKTPAALPEISFKDGDGKAKSMKDWRGKVVLLNIWATWCAPCRREMPELDSLQGELGSDGFEVIALSVDRKGLKASKRFLQQIKVKHLGLYNDATTRAAAKLKVVGMPTTLLIDAKGRELGRLVGPAEWHSEDAKRLIRAQL